MIAGMTDATNPSPPRHRYSIPMYIGAGGFATASHYATTIALVELGGIAPLLATTVGFGVGALVKYALNYFVAFRSAAPHSAAVPRFVLTVGAMFALNVAFFSLFHERLGLHYMIAQVLTTGMLIPPGYLMSRLWVFRAC
jgi:putative flippase GtrA